MADAFGSHVASESLELAGFLRRVRISRVMAHLFRRKRPTRFTANGHPLSVDPPHLEIATIDVLGLENSVSGECQNQNGSSCWGGAPQSLPSGMWKAQRRLTIAYRW